MSHFNKKSGKKKPKLPFYSVFYVHFQDIFADLVSFKLVSEFRAEVEEIIRQRYEPTKSIRHFSFAFHTLKVEV